MDSLTTMSPSERTPTSVEPPQNAYIRGAAADIDYHGALGAEDVEPRAYGACLNLFLDEYIGNAQHMGELYHSVALKLRDLAGAADKARRLF